MLVNLQEIKMIVGPKVPLSSRREHSKLVLLPYNSNDVHCSHSKPFTQNRLFGKQRDWKWKMEGKIVYHDAIPVIHIKVDLTAPVPEP
jgi:hypothetical protein